MTTVVLVTGGRDYNDADYVNGVLDAMLAHYGELIIINGGANGLDLLSIYWADSREQHYVTMKALWRRYPKAAGPIRNSMMLKLRPDICVGFPGGKGTADMLAKARAAGVETYEV